MFPIEQWPYSNFHDLNLDWVLRTLRSAMAQIGEALESAEGLVDKVNKNTADIAALKNTIAQVQASVDAGLEQVQADIQTAINSANSYTDTEVAALKENTDTEIANLKENIDDYIEVIDPVYGGTVPLQTALDHLADQGKTDALTAGEYDALELTAEAYDNYQLTAFQYDTEGKKLLTPAA